MTDPPEPLTRVLWHARIGEEELNFTDGFELPDLSWLSEGTSRFMAQSGDKVYSVTASRSAGGDRVVALVPFDETTAADISAHWWFDVAFFGLDEAHVSVAESEEDEESEISAEATSDGAINISIDGERPSRRDEFWPGGRTAARACCHNRTWSGFEWWLIWSLSIRVRPSKRRINSPFFAPRRATSGMISPCRDMSSASNSGGLLPVSGPSSSRSATQSRWPSSATMILSITRSTSRLTAGARAVERGDLDHRVPVKRHDQLGDLARSFNHMTDSVQSMLADVAEKERLARELELAREIQESLLPASHLEVGPISVRATFQPATEVGGDYFDVFPISEDRVVVAIGDVAGHGLSTGLLMASLKSSVAALVHEGYGGTDLIEKVNHLLMEHGQARTMATLTVVEIDLDEGRLVLANAGHCPALLILPEGMPDELMVSSVPMGSRLGSPASLERPFPAGSRLILYSDGLVEAISPDGEPFGYQRLEEVVAAATDLSGSGLTTTILDALAGTPTGPLRPTT